LVAVAQVVVRLEIKTDQMVLIRYFRQSHRLAAAAVAVETVPETMADRVVETQEQETRQAQLHRKVIMVAQQILRQAAAAVVLVLLVQAQPQT
jgi:hypothetical protein